MITIYGRDDCPFCQKAKEFAQYYFSEYNYIDTPKGEAFAELKDYIFSTYNENVTTVPQIIINNEHIGGYDDLIGWILRKDTL